MSDPETAADVPASWSAGVGFAALALCLALAPAFPGDGDAGEFTLALALRGVPHPTGYPLYVLLGHGWVAALHALGAGWAWAANAWSAAGAGVAVGLLHALAARLLPDVPGLQARGRAAVAGVAAALLSLDAAFLREATVAEVSSWQLAALLALALAALAVLRGAAPADGSGLARRAFVFGLAAGAALAHHATSVFFVVPLAAAAAFACTRARRLRPALALAALGGALLPLLSHAHTVFRAWHPAAFQWPLLEPSAASVLEHVSGRVFAVYLGGFAPRPGEAALLAAAIAPLAVPGLALAGLAVARERLAGRGLLLGALLAGALLQSGFVFAYGVPDGVPYLLPVLAVGLLGLAAAGAPLAPRLANAGALVALALALAVHGAFGLAWLDAHHRSIGLVARTIHERWRALPFERGIVLWNSDHYTHLVIHALLEGEKRGVVVDNPATLTWPAARSAFLARTGIDPLAGLALRDDSELVLVAPNVARRSSLPVVDFALWRPGGAPTPGPRRPRRSRRAPGAPEGARRVGLRARRRTLRGTPPGARARGSQPPRPRVSSARGTSDQARRSDT